MIEVFVNVLSINVAEYWVMRVGFFIVNINLYQYEYWHR